MEEFKPSYIAFLDVLGFSNLVSRGKEFEKIFKDYITIIRETIKKVDPDFSYSVFSDTIIIFTNDSKWTTLMDLSRIVSAISYELIVEKGVPLKGAISHGRFTNFKKESDRILAGKPIVEAYKYEQYQNWIGSMLTPSVLRYVGDIHEKLILDNHYSLTQPATVDRIKKNMNGILSLTEYSISFKNDERYQGMAIVPHKLNCTDPQHVGEDLKVLLRKIKTLKFQADDPYVQRKYQNTETFLYEMTRHYGNGFRTTHWENEIWIETKDGKKVCPKRN